MVPGRFKNPEGNWLNKYADGGTTKPLRRYPWGGPMFSDPQALSELVTNWQTNFENEKNKELQNDLTWHEGWLNSPMYRKMLYGDTPGDYGGNTKEELDRIDAIRRENLEKAKNAQLEFIYRDIDGGVHGSADYRNNKVKLFKLGFDNPTVLTHELRHLLDNPYKIRAGANTVLHIPDPNYDPLLDYENPPKPISPNRDIDYAVRGVIDYDDSKKCIEDGTCPPEGFGVNPDDDKKYFKKRKEYNSWRDYITEQTEINARLAEIRQQAQEQKIYDPYNEPAPKNFFKLFESKGINTWPLKNLRDFYTDDEILYMLNNFSYNDKEKNDTGIYQSKLGGTAKRLKQYAKGGPGKPTAKIDFGKGIGVMPVDINSQLYRDIYPNLMSSGVDPTTGQSTMYGTPMEGITYMEDAPQHIKDLRQYRQDYISKDRSAFRDWYDALGYNTKSVNDRAERYAYDKVAEEIIDSHRDLSKLSEGKKNIIAKSSYANKLEPGILKRFGTAFEKTFNPFSLAKQVFGPSDPDYHPMDLLAPLEYPSEIVRAIGTGDIYALMTGQPVKKYFRTDNMPAGYSPLELEFANAAMNIGTDPMAFVGDEILSGAGNLAKKAANEYIYSPLNPLNLETPSGAEWMKNWINHPDFTKKYAASLDIPENLRRGNISKLLDNERISLSNRLHQYKPKTYFDLLKDKGFKKYIDSVINTGGLSYGVPDQIYVNKASYFPFNNRGLESTRVHELTHLVEKNGALLDRTMQKKLLSPFGYDAYSDIVSTTGPQSSLRYYLHPTEIHARMNEARFNLGLNPGDKFTEEMFDKILKTRDWFGMGKYIKDKKAFIDLMNNFWAVPAAGVAGAALSGQEETPKQKLGGSIGWLDQYAGGGEPCPDGYIKNWAGICIKAPKKSKSTLEAAYNLVSKPKPYKKYEASDPYQKYRKDQLGYENRVYTYGTDPQWFDNHAIVWDNRNSKSDEQYNKLVKDLVYKGTHGFNPVTGELIKLNSPVNVPEITKEISTEEWGRKTPNERFESDTPAGEKIRRDEAWRSMKEMVQNPIFYAPGMIAAAPFIGAASSVPLLSGMGTTITLGDALGLGFGLEAAQHLGKDLNTGYYTSDAPLVNKIGNAALTGLGLSGLPGVRSSLSNAYGKLGEFTKNYAVGYMNPSRTRGFMLASDPAYVAANTPKSFTTTNRLGTFGFAKARPGTTSTLSTSPRSGYQGTLADGTFYTSGRIINSPINPSESNFLLGKPDSIEMLNKSIEYNPSNNLIIKSIEDGSPLEKQLNKSGEINIKSLQAYINKNEVTNADKYIIQQVLDKYFPNKNSINYNEFKNKVSDELVTLNNETFVEHNTNHGVGALGFPKPRKESYEKAMSFGRSLIALYEKKLANAKALGDDALVLETQEELNRLNSELEKNTVDYNKIPRENKTILFSNEGQFGRGSDLHYNEKTLGHSRYLVSNEEPDIFHVLESQSDFYQKNKMKSFDSVFKESYQKRLKRLEEIQNKNKEVLKNMKEKGVDEAGYKVEPYQIEQFEDIVKRQEVANNMAKGDFANYEQKRLLGKKHLERLLQENVAYAAKNGQKIMRYPTPETAAKIQGYRKHLSGYEPEHETILKKYEETPKMVKKILGEDTRIVTDDKGNTWYEFNIPKPFLEGKGKIVALSTGALVGLGSLGSGSQSENKEMKKYGGSTGWLDQYIGGGPRKGVPVKVKDPVTGAVKEMDIASDEYRKLYPSLMSKGIDSVSGQPTMYGAMMDPLVYEDKRKKSSLWEDFTRSSYNPANWFKDDLSDVEGIKSLDDAYRYAALQKVTTPGYTGSWNVDEYGAPTSYNFDTSGSGASDTFMYNGKRYKISPNNEIEAQEQYKYYNEHPELHPALPGEIREYNPDGSYKRSTYTGSATPTMGPIEAAIAAMAFGPMAARAITPYVAPMGAMLDAPLTIGSTVVPGVTAGNTIGLGFGAYGAGMLGSDIIDTGYYGSDAPLEDKIARGVETGLNLLGTPGTGKLLLSGARNAKNLGLDAGKYLTTQIKKLPFSPRSNSSILGTAGDNSSIYNGPHVNWNNPNIEAHENITSVIDDIRAEKLQNWNTDEGRRRIQKMIDDTPFLKNNGITVDTYINAIAGMSNENREYVAAYQELKKLTDEANQLDYQFENGLSNLTNDQYFNESVRLDELLKNQEQVVINYRNEINKRGLANAYMKGVEIPTTATTGSINLNKKPFKSFAIGLGEGNKPEDLRQVIEHEIGHLLQAGSTTSLDDQLKQLEFHNDSYFNEAPTHDKLDSWLKAKTAPGYLTKTKRYFQTGSEGREKLPFVLELRRDMLDKGFIKHDYDNITPEMIQTYYIKYKKGELNQAGKEMPLRIFDMMRHSKSNYKLLSDVLNNAPVIALGVTGALGAGAAASGEKQQQKYGGSTRWLDQYDNGGPKPKSIYATQKINDALTVGYTSEPNTIYVYYPHNDQWTQLTGSQYSAFSKNNPTIISSAPKNPNLTVNDKRQNKVVNTRVEPKTQKKQLPIIPTAPDVSTPNTNWAPNTKAEEEFLKTYIYRNYKKKKDEPFALQNLTGSSLMPTLVYTSGEDDKKSGRFWEETLIGQALKKEKERLSKIPLSEQKKANNKNSNRNAMNWSGFGPPPNSSYMGVPTYPNEGIMGVPLPEWVPGYGGVTLGNTITDLFDRRIASLFPEDEESIGEATSNIELLPQQPTTEDNKPKSRTKYGFYESKDSKTGDWRVPDVSGLDTDKLAKFNYTWNNDTGGRYYVSHKEKEMESGKHPSRFENVYAVAHFLRDADILPDQEFYPEQLTTHGSQLPNPGYKSKKYISHSGVSNDPEKYWMLYKKGNKENEYYIKYKKQKDITDEDRKTWTVDLPTNGQHRYSDVDWDAAGKSTGYASKSNWVPLKKGAKNIASWTDLENTRLPYRDKDGYSRFSGASVTYLFKDPLTGESIARDVAGSINEIKNVGKNIVAIYGISPDDLEFIYHDTGSYSAKPAAYEGNIINHRQWANYNSLNQGYSGAALMVPSDKYGGSVKKLKRYDDGGPIIPELPEDFLHKANVYAWNQGRKAAQASENAFLEENSRINQMRQRAENNAYSHDPSWDNKPFCITLPNGQPYCATRATEVLKESGFPLPITPLSKNLESQLTKEKGWIPVDRPSVPGDIAITRRPGGKAWHTMISAGNNVLYGDSGSGKNWHSYNYQDLPTMNRHLNGDTHFYRYEGNLPALQEDMQGKNFDYMYKTYLEPKKKGGVKTSAEGYYDYINGYKGVSLSKGGPSRNSWLEKYK